MKNIKKTKVSVIIPVYNRKKLLDECINSVIQQDYNNKEIIVINDNSKEDITSLIKTKYPGVNLINNKFNKGPSFAKNQGILASKGDCLLFMDSDTEFIEKNAISKMMNVLEKNKKVGCIGGEIILDEKGAKTKVAGNSLKGYVYADKRKRLRKCGFLNTSNCMVRKNTAIKARGFDPYYFYPMEDADFGLAVERLGYQNMVSFDSGVIHKYSKEMRLNRIYTLYRAKTRFLIRNYGIVRAICSIPFDINESFINPINSFLIRKIISGKKKKQGGGVLGPVEQNIFCKLSVLLMVPFALLYAYIWNILNIRMTLSSRNRNFLDPKNMREYEKRFL